MSSDEFRRYLIDKNVPEEYWVNYRRTQRGNFIENVKVIPASLLSDRTKCEYERLARRANDRFEAFLQLISNELEGTSSEGIGKLIRGCIASLANDIEELRSQNRERPKRSIAATERDTSYIRLSHDFYCRYQAAKLFEGMAARGGVIEQKIVNEQFQLILNEVLHERFARFGDRTPGEIFKSLIRQHGERPTPFLREDPDLYEFFRRGLRDLGSLPSPFPASDLDQEWYSAVLEKIVGIETNLDNVASRGTWSLERPSTTSGTRAFVGILKDSRSEPVSVIKIASGPDRLEEILSELALDGFHEQAILPKAWGRFGNENFFALYTFAGSHDEDQRYGPTFSDTQASRDFVREHGQLLSDFHTQALPPEKKEPRVLATYRDDAQRVYNIGYDIRVLEQRLESVPSALSRKIHGLITAYRNLLVCHPSSIEDGMIHGDLYPSNMFRTEAGCRVIDNNQAAYYLGRVASTGDPAKDVGKSVGYFLVEWARRQKIKPAGDNSIDGERLDEVMDHIDGLVESYLNSRRKSGYPIQHEEQFKVGTAFHACSFAAKNWTDLRGLKFTSLEGGPPTDSMRSSLFAGVQSYLERITIPPLSYESTALDRFWSRPADVA
jgi:hypothetical protein